MPLKRWFRLISLHFVLQIPRSDAIAISHNLLQSAGVATLPALDRWRLWYGGATNRIVLRRRYRASHPRHDLIGSNSQRRGALRISLRFLEYEGNTIILGKPGDSIVLAVALSLGILGGSWWIARNLGFPGGITIVGLLSYLGVFLGYLHALAALRSDLIGVIRSVYPETERLG